MSAYRFPFFTSCRHLNGRIVVGIGPHHLRADVAAPSVELLAKFVHQVRSLPDKIAGFAQVFIKIVKLYAFGVKGFDQLPWALANDAGRDAR